MQIVVLDGYTLNPCDNPWDLVEALGELTVYDRTPMDQIVDRVGRAEIVLTNKTPLDGPTLAALPSLRFISVLPPGTMWSTWRLPAGKASRSRTCRSMAPTAWRSM